MTFGMIIILEVPYQTFWQRFELGRPTFYTMKDFEDLASMERWLKQPTRPDAETFQELVSRSADIWIEDSIEMLLLESV